jgi:hypothetical protein
MTTIPASDPTLPHAARTNRAGVINTFGTPIAMPRIIVGISPAPSAIATPINMTRTRPRGSKWAKFSTISSTNQLRPSRDSSDRGRTCSERLTNLIR